MKQKLGLIGLAILAVSTAAQDPEMVAEAELTFPWAASNDDAPAVPGNPPQEAEIARRYWRSNWALLHGDVLPRPVLWTHPVDGGTEHATAVSIESWVSIVFARALDEQALSASQFHIVDSTDTPAPFAIDLFYGNGSHVVHLKPTGDLIDDEVYVVTVDPGVKTIHGESLAGWRFSFSTGLDGPAPINDDGFWDLPDPYGEPVGESSGGPDSTTGASSGGDAESSGGAPGPTEGAGTGVPGSTGEGSTGPAAEGGASEGGCGCKTETGQPGPGGLGLAVLLGLAARRRRRS